MENPLAMSADSDQAWANALALVTAYELGRESACEAVLPQDLYELRRATVALAVMANALAVSRAKSLGVSTDAVLQSIGKSVLGSMRDQKD
jgi:hypothetical protein